MKIWGIHMGEKVGSSPLIKNYVGIGWPELGNLKPIASSREQLKQELLNTYPDIKKGAVSTRQGTKHRYLELRNPA